MASIVLMGIKHCGKSTQAKRLGAELGLENFDTDDLITEMTGATPREIYTKAGEEVFKAAEKNACDFLVAKIRNEKKDCVIATGGGICKNPDALESLRAVGRLVFLNSPENAAADRIVREIQTDSNGKMTGLPAYIANKNPKNVDEVRKIFHDFYVDRVKIYESLADVTVSMGNDSKAENTIKILAILGLR